MDLIQRKNMLMTAFCPFVHSTVCCLTMPSIWWSFRSKNGYWFNPNHKTVKQTVYLVVKWRTHSSKYTTRLPTMWSIQRVSIVLIGSKNNKISLWSVTSSCKPNQNALLSATSWPPSILVLQFSLITIPLIRSQLLQFCFKDSSFFKHLKLFGRH